MKIHLSKFMILLIGLGFVGCTPATDPQVAFQPATSATVKVGESLTLTLTTAFESVRLNPDPTGQQAFNPEYTAFIYSPKANDPQKVTLGQEAIAPYYPASQGGFQPISDPALFPINPVMEMVTPLATAGVPKRAPVVVNGQSAQAEFVVRGVSPGTVILKGGFYSNLKDSTSFLRKPIRPEEDGSITIQVVP